MITVLDVYCDNYVQKHLCRSLNGNAVCKYVLVLLRDVTENTCSLEQATVVRTVYCSNPVLKTDLPLQCFVFNSYFRDLITSCGNRNKNKTSRLRLDYVEMLLLALKDSNYLHISVKRKAAFQK